MVGMLCVTIEITLDELVVFVVDTVASRSLVLVFVCRCAEKGELRR